MLTIKKALTIVFTPENILFKVFTPKSIFIEKFYTYLFNDSTPEKSFIPHR
jgi:hypothetical protein